MTGSTFAEMAVALKAIAFAEACGAEALEIMAARSDEAVFTVTLREARLSARHAGEAYALIRSLIPHEDLVKQLIEAGTE